ncbi:DUF2844 domain-containing protein [Geomonas sp. Red32]|uniref:DUF2844 domain-containing protein n=1 Tax=Geomonas sp. Red32 TaxID=2912856 RepID=UPI00331305FF
MSRDGCSVNEIADGTTIVRECVSASGIVFTIAWDGTPIPASGNYWGAYAGGVLGGTPEGAAGGRTPASAAGDRCDGRGELGVSVHEIS